MNRQEFNDTLETVIEEYRNNISVELKERWNSWNIEINSKEIYEVNGGLLCRQVILMRHFAIARAAWNSDLAPIFHRTQIDNFISLSWILLDPLERAKKYIYHGLGVEKLNINARKEQLKLDGYEDNNDPLIEYSQAWLSSQRYDFLTEVNFGSWSGISTKKMAEESNNIQLYNYSYQPFSSTSHNMWNHIGKMCMRQSENPLHKLLHIPTIVDYEPDLWSLELGAKYLDRSFKCVDNFFPLLSNIKSSYETLIKELETISIKIQESNGM